MNDRSRPEAAPESTAKTTSNIVARRRWAYSLARRCTTPPPPYGSSEWLALSDGTPEKVAAVVNAAEAWARDGDNLADNLWRELEEHRRLDKAAEEAECVARAAEHRERYRHLRLVAHPYPLYPKPLEEIGAEYMRRQRAGDLDAG